MSYFFNKGHLQFTGCFVCWSSHGRYASEAAAGIALCTCTCLYVDASCSLWTPSHCISIAINNLVHACRAVDRLSDWYVSGALYVQL